MHRNRYYLHLKLASAMAHGDTLPSSVGSNATLFMRQHAVVHDVPTRVPAISGNALRSCMVRRPLADNLLYALGVEEGSLRQSVVNLLYAGGSLRKGAKAPAVESDLAQTVLDMYPNLRLLGGSLDAFLLPKSDLNLTPWIVCAENAAALRCILEDRGLGDSLSAGALQTSVFDLVHEEVRTRGTGSQAAGSQMLYQYETLAVGTEVVIECALQPWTKPVVVSALAAAIEAWDGFLGGQNRQGRGRAIPATGQAASSVWLESPEGIPMPGLWADFVVEHAPAMLDGLLEGTLGTDREVLA